MMMSPARPAQSLPLEAELLDEEAWAAPERLTNDDCYEQLGADWRWPSARPDEDLGYDG